MTDHIDNWHGKPIGDMTRGELVDALDWCVSELRRYKLEKDRAALLKLSPMHRLGGGRDTRKCTGR